MRSWWKRSVPAFGSVLYRHDIPSTLQEFDYLQQLGVTVKQLPANADAAWQASLRHPAWGEAIITCPRESSLPGKEIVGVTPYLNQQERDAILAARSSVIVKLEMQHGNILRDRKLLLRFLNALMSSAGIVAIDWASHEFWTSEMLADELCHDADLDVEALFTLHALMENLEKGAYWIHSHGLQEMGFFDFSILNPSSSLPPDLYRAIAYSILEETAVIGAKMTVLTHPRKDVLLLPAHDFLKQGNPDAVARIKDQMDDLHQEKSVVLCEPTDGGWFGRLFAKGILPARVLSTDFPDEGMMAFSHAATELMEIRARGTYAVFRRLGEDFIADDLPLPMLAKIGYVVDNGGPDEKEHLWFLVKGFRDDAIDGELVNTPFQIARMKLGDRGMHAIDGLSDWTIMTPCGPITPRNATSARALRALDAEKLDELRAMLKENE